MGPGRFLMGGATVHIPTFRKREKEKGGTAMVWQICYLIGMLRILANERDEEE